MIKKREGWRVTIPEPYKSRIENNQCPGCGKEKSEWTRRTDWTCCSKECSEEYYHKQVIMSWPEVRAKALKRDGHKCIECSKAPKRMYKHWITGEEIETEELDLIGDHIIPIALGGEEFDINNVQTLCGSCNKIKTREDIKKIAEARRVEKILVPNQTQLCD